MSQGGETFVYYFSSDKWVRSEASKKNNFAVQMNTNDLVPGDNVNELENLVVSSTREIQGIGGNIVDDTMGVKVEFFLILCGIYWVMGQMKKNMKE